MTGSLTPHDFRALLDPLLAPLGAQGEGPLAVAVSGGGDSMALMLLAHAAYGRVTALTVDHGLRAESADEARRVAAWACALGVPHRILEWTGDKPATGIQAAARTARYRLLAQACAALGPRASAAPLIVAHTREDQAETFLLRLAHGSDLGGLAAMRAASEIAGAPPVPLLRPLLDVSREALRAVLRERPQEWIEDPSNLNQNFERPRLRRLMPALAETGVTSHLLVRASRLMRRIEDRLIDAGAGACRFAPDGSAAIDLKRLDGLPAPIAQRALSRLVRAVGGEAYPPGRDSLERLADALKNPTARGMTLAGCRFIRGGSGWQVTRELRAARHALTLPSGGIALWDNRFWVRLPPGGNAPFTIRAIGPAARPMTRIGLAQETLPGAWQDERLIYIPEIAESVEGFAASGERPVALFVGEARVDGSLCKLWSEVAERQKNSIPKQCLMPTVS